MKDQPLSTDASPTALSPSYIANFNPEEDEEDPEEDPADYPANEGDNLMMRHRTSASADPSAVPTDDPCPQADDIQRHLRQIALLLHNFTLRIHIIYFLKPNPCWLRCLFTPYSMIPICMRHAPLRVCASTTFIEMMTTVNQRMSVEEIERVVAQRVVNAIEAIAIYETKTNMARNHNRQCTVKFENCKKVDHMTQDYECGSLRHFKSECPIVKFQKRVDKKIPHSCWNARLRNKKSLKTSMK
ncbi:hypothetical protein Tco_1378187 [Tanacetum coccineum]